MATKVSIMRLAVCAAVLAALTPAHAKPPQTTARADFAVILDEVQAVCSAKWRDAALRSQLCAGKFDATLRMLGALEGVAGRHNPVAMPHAPAIVRGAGAMNEFMYVEMHIDGLCRGAVTDDEKLRDRICEVRGQLDRVLNKHGYCYGMRGQIGADMRWHRCARNSLRQ